MGRGQDTCVTPVSPYGAAVVAVAKPKSRLGLALGSAAFAAGPCSMRRVEEFSMPRFLTAAIGAFFFSAAPQLAESTPFRLAGGSLGFTALSALVFIFLLYRSIPHRRSFLLSSALFGGTMAAAARFVFGTWLPSAGQLARNPVVLAYAALSALQR